MYPIIKEIIFILVSAYSLYLAYKVEQLHEEVEYLKQYKRLYEKLKRKCNK